MDNSKVPRAPCATLMSEKVRMQESPAIGITPAQTNLSSTPSDEGIAIPLDSNFFTHAEGMEREEGEIASSKPCSVSSDIPRWTSPPKRYSIDGGKRPRRSPSPEPARHRLPPSRAYLNRSPERLARLPSRRSQSPSTSRRPISLEYMPGRRTPSPEGPRRRRSTPGTKTFEPAPPRSPRSAMPKRRGSDYDTRRRRSKDSDGESYLSRESYKESLASPYSEGHRDAFIAHDVSNHNRGRGSTRERDSVESSHTQQSKPSNNYKSRSLSGVPTTPSPSSIPGPLPDAAKPDSASSSQLVKPCHNVPGLWMVKSGRRSIEIVTCEFEIDKIAADRWGIRSSSRYVCSSQSLEMGASRPPLRHGKEKAPDALSLSLACVPLSEIVALQGKLDLASAAPQEIANEMAQIETVWPPAGHVVVQINHDQEWGRSWLPRHLVRISVFRGTWNWNQCTCREKTSLLSIL